MRVEVDGDSEAKEKHDAAINLVARVVGTYCFMIVQVNTSEGWKTKVDWSNWRNDGIDEKCKGPEFAPDLYLPKNYALYNAFRDIGEYPRGYPDGFSGEWTWTDEDGDPVKYSTLIGDGISWLTLAEMDAFDWQLYIWR